jgi:hypothetical protein
MHADRTGNVCAMFARGYIEVLFKTAATPLRASSISPWRATAASISRPSRWCDAAKAHERLGAAGFALRPLVNMQRRSIPRGETRDRRLYGRSRRARRHGGRPHPDPHASHRGCGLAESAGSRIPRRRARWRASLSSVPDVEEAAARFARFTGRHATATSSGQGDCARSRSVELVTRARFEAALPEIAVAGLPFMGAYGVGSRRSMAVTRTFFRRAGLRHAARRLSGGAFSRGVGPRRLVVF